MARHGRSHPQTVSAFAPDLAIAPMLNELIFRGQGLHFATCHVYEKGTIDAPRDTVAPAIAMGRLVRAALGEIRDGRPFLDSEHGPIHAFKDRGRTLCEPFDDEYFRHLQWAHFASGAAGGGMRWPYRHPHTLTAGMRVAQRALGGFLPLIDFAGFRRRNINAELRITSAAEPRITSAAEPRATSAAEPRITSTALALFGCGDASQAIVWLLRTDQTARARPLRRNCAPVHARLEIPGLGAGRYRITSWDTSAGIALDVRELEHDGGPMLAVALPPIAADLALAIRRL